MVLFINLIHKENTYSLKMPTMTTTASRLLMRPATFALSKRATNMAHRGYIVTATTQEDAVYNEAYQAKSQEEHHQVAPLTNTTIYAANEDVLTFSDTSAPFSPTVNAVFDD